MDFFERQDEARRHTKWLLVYFALAVAAIIAVVYVVIAVTVGIKFRGELWNPGEFLAVAVATLGTIFCASAYKMNELASGGSAVARMMRGRPVHANTTDPDERRLLNVIEEMAIASGTPMPLVFVLPEERGINAFAAGHSTNDMAICVTGGAMKLLTRDEMQGVIGHEFSHILNGDMRMNLRLMGLIFGILCIALCGRLLLEIRGRRNALPLLGLALIAIGSIGVFFGKLIKSAVSRQREFLADASSAQFTRNPGGLANALKKIGGAGSRLNASNAEMVSHLFFANGMRESMGEMFSTHPPLEQRIRALDPGWDGRFITTARIEAPAPATTIAPQFRAGGIPGNPATAAALIGLAGSPTQEHLEYAADLRDKLPAEFAAAAREPIAATALIYALLLSKDDATRAAQIAELSDRTDPAISTATQQFSLTALGLESRARLPLATLAMPALRQLTPAQFGKFQTTLRYLIESDGRVELFEFALQKMVLRQLEPTFAPPKKPVIQYYVMKPLIPDCMILLSALAYAGHANLTQVETAFRRGATGLRPFDAALLPSDECTISKIDAALDRLNQGAPQTRKRALLACAEVAAADGIIVESEAELLRAIADALDCPIPPLITI